MTKRLCQGIRRYILGLLLAVAIPLLCGLRSLLVERKAGVVEHPPTFTHNPLPRKALLKNVCIAVHCTEVEVVSSPLRVTEFASCAKGDS